MGQPGNIPGWPFYLACKMDCPTGRDCPLRLIRQGWGHATEKRGKMKSKTYEEFVEKFKPMKKQRQRGQRRFAGVFQRVKKPL